MYEEKDFIVRQIKGIAKTLGKFMGLEQVKEVIDINEDQREAMSDDELETILAAAKLENILMKSEYTVKEVATETAIEQDRLQLFLNNEAIANDEELSQLLDFINDNREYL
jgi:hypothetical protein